MFQRPLQLIALFLLTQWSVAQTNLRYNLEVGETFTVAQTAKQTITQEIPGMTQIIINDLSGTMRFTVTAVTDTLTTLEMTFQKFALKMSSPQLGTLMEIDTENEETSESTESKIFQGMLHKAVYIEMKPTGEIVNIKDADAIINGMVSNLGLEDPAMVAQMKKELEKEWSADSLAKSFEQMTFNYPDAAVVQGGSWNNAFIGKGNVNAKNTWTLDEVSDEAIAISGDATIEMDLTNPQIQMVLTGSQQTSLRALPNGFPNTMEVKTFAAGDASTPQLPGQTIPTKLESTTTYTLL